MGWEDTWEAYWDSLRRRLSKGVNPIFFLSPRRVWNSKCKKSHIKQRHRLSHHLHLYHHKVGKNEQLSLIFFLKHRTSLFHFLMTEFLPNLIGINISIRDKPAPLTSLSFLFSTNLEPINTRGVLSLIDLTRKYLADEQKTGQKLQRNKNQK